MKIKGANRFYFQVYDGMLMQVIIEKVDYDEVKNRLEKVHAGHSGSWPHALRGIENLKASGSIWRYCRFDRKDIQEVIHPDGHPDHEGVWLCGPHTKIGQVKNTYLAAFESIDKSKKCHRTIEEIRDLMRLEKEEVYPVFLKEVANELIQIDGLHRMIAYLIETKPDYLFGYVGRV